MRLGSLSEYRRSYFTPDSAPATGTVRAQAKAGTLPGVFHGGRWFIDFDELERRLHLTAKLDAREKEIRQRPELEGLV